MFFSQLSPTWLNRHSNFLFYWFFFCLQNQGALLHTLKQHDRYTTSPPAVMQSLQRSGPAAAEEPQRFASKCVIFAWLAFPRSAGCSDATIRSAFLHRHWCSTAGEAQQRALKCIKRIQDDLKPFFLRVERTWLFFFWLKTPAPLSVCHPCPSHSSSSSSLQICDCCCCVAHLGLDCNRLCGQISQCMEIRRWRNW